MATALGNRNMRYSFMRRDRTSTPLALVIAMKNVRAMQAALAPSKAIVQHDILATHRALLEEINLSIMGQ